MFTMLSNATYLVCYSAIMCIYVTVTMHAPVFATLNPAPLILSLIHI